MKRTKEKATVSFHYLQKERKNGKDTDVVPFTSDELNSLRESVADQLTPDLSEPAILARVRNGVLVPFYSVKVIDSRTFAGQFKVPYSGHSFYNSDKGKILAESVNQRDFHFVVYLSDDGKLFIGAQYLGSYGGYETLRYGLLRHLPDQGGVRSYSYRREVFNPSEVQAKEVRINVHHQSDSLHHDNSLTRKSVIVLRRENRKDVGFEAAVRRDVIPIFASDATDRKAQLAKVLTDTGLISVDDAEIEGCVMIADVNGIEKTFNFIGDSSFATRFSLDVPYNLDGHPEPIPTQEKILEKLDQEIIKFL